MAIITCPDCGHHPLSDRAAACPICACPIASTTASTGQQTIRDSQATTAVVDSTQAIAALAAIVKEAQRELISPEQAKAVASQIAERKKAAFSTRQEFIDASVKAGILILSNEDINLLNGLTSEQKSAFTTLYALGCHRLDDSMAKQLCGFRSLRRLDLSYCSEMTGAVVGRAFNNWNDLGLLEELYLRSCHRIDESYFGGWIKQSKHISIVCLDGNSQIDLATMMFIKYVPTLQKLSIIQCRQLDDPDSIRFLQMLIKRECPKLSLSGP